MSAISIRKMESADIDAVVAVENASFLTPWSRAAFEEEINENDLAHYLVMECDWQVVAYAGMWMILDEAHITNVAVLPQHRHQGLGKALLTSLINKARDLGATAMTLEVRVSNAVARQLYEHFGFFEKGRRRQYYTDTQEDA
ncbi:MAG: ribosomal-protein-alanine acetyltransferase, partial [Firmicutes bacterium]|nr:ribosomal-protein-alanine acetyltransferase [Bacillota bacterium]